MSAHSQLKSSMSAEEKLLIAWTAWKEITKLASPQRPSTYSNSPFLYSVQYGKDSALDGRPYHPYQLDVSYIPNHVEQCRGIEKKERKELEEKLKARWRIQISTLLLNFRLNLKCPACDGKVLNHQFGPLDWKPVKDMMQYLDGVKVHGVHQKFMDAIGKYFLEAEDAFLMNDETASVCKGLDSIRHWIKKSRLSWAGKDVELVYWNVPSNLED